MYLTRMRKKINLIKNNSVRFNFAKKTYKKYIYFYELH
jgi:hypothetical protein